jgi:hypothetical protein
VEGLEGPREAVEERAAGGSVGEGVDGGDEEVEGDAPVCEYGEVAELGAGGGAAAEGLVGAVPAEDEDFDDESVETLRGWRSVSGL